MNNNLPDPRRSILETDILRLRQFQRDGQFAEALQIAERHLAQFPDNRDLLIIAAISLRHLKRIDQAMTLLDRLEASQPRFSRLHEERGLCLVQLRDAPAAIDSLLRAVNINPALPMSWHILEGLYRMTGDESNQAKAASHVAALKQLPPAVVSATGLFSDGDLIPAEQVIRAFLLSHGNHPEAMRLLAKIGMANDVLDDAELLLRGVLTLAPDYRAARYDFADCLVKRHKFAEAKVEIDQLLAEDPDNFDYRSMAATICVGLGRHAESIALYQKMIADAPQSPDLRLWLGHALKTIGSVPEAVESYRMAAQLRPDFGDAFWSMANLKLYRFTDDEITAMQARESAPETHLVDRYHLCFALGKAFEDRADYQQSWHYYQRGNQLKRSESRYRPEVIETNTRLQIATCSADFFERRQGFGNQQADPIFIVGLPRSGSTLLEQILASHSQVEGTQELPNIQRIVIGLQGADADLDHPRYPGVLSDLSAEDFRRFGDNYIAETQVYRSGKPFFIDKMPNNFRHIGLIQLMLPNAKIIDARREPMSCCFSNLKQLFAQGQEFSYSISDIARYYRTYLELMRHWDAVLPGRVLRVQHEDVVEDLEGSVRRILEYCGLEFEAGCVEFHKTSRSVRTPSSEQVRRPIFRDGLEVWRNYEGWLGELRGELGDAVESYRG